MIVVIPVKSEKEPLLSPLGSASSFAFVTLKEGMQKEKISFQASFSNQFFDYIVVSDKGEEIDEAFELGARALLAKEGMSIDEIVEAMMFRELDEIG